MRTLTVLALFALVGVTPAPAADRPTNPKELLGEKVVALLKGATKVEVFRVDSDKPGATDKAVAGYRITAVGKDRDATFAKAVWEVATSKDTYEFNAAKGCIFRPGVAFRVWKGEESVAFVICFACDQMAIVTLDKDGKAVATAHAETDPGRAALLKLAKTAFPDDKEIQKLKEKR
jgi:hypothetical protein